MSTDFSNGSSTGVVIADGFQSASDVTVTASATLAASDSGKVVYVGTDALVYSLPAAAAGLSYTFINTGADGAAIITISPATGEQIHGTIILASSVVELTGSGDKDLINTKTTANTGDSVSLVCNGTAWYVTSSTGIWASEA